MSFREGKDILGFFFLMEKRYFVLDKEESIRRMRNKNSNKISRAIRCWLLFSIQKSESRVGLLIFLCSSCVYDLLLNLYLRNCHFFWVKLRNDLLIYMQCITCFFQMFTTFCPIRIFGHNYLWDSWIGPTLKIPLQWLLVRVLFGTST
jgi:hypothetical protein